MIKLINTTNSWTIVEKSILSLAGIMLSGKIKQPSQRCLLNIWMGLSLSYHSYTVVLSVPVQKAYRLLFVYVILCAFHNYLSGAQRSQRHIHYIWADTKYTLFILTPSIHDLNHVGYEAFKMHLDLTLAKLLLQMSFIGWIFHQNLHKSLKRRCNTTACDSFKQISAIEVFFEIKMLNVLCRHNLFNIWY